MSESQVKEMQLRRDRANLSLKRDRDRLGNYDLEVSLAKSDYEAKLANLAAEKERLESSIAKLEKEVAEVEDALKSD